MTNLGEPRPYLNKKAKSRAVELELYKHKQQMDASMISETEGIEWYGVGIY